VIRSSATSSALWRRDSTIFWMTASFLVAAGLAATVFGAVDARDRVGVALRVTARWSFLLFWLAYTGRAMSTLWGPPFNRLARYGREFGLAFASAHLVHVGIILGTEPAPAGWPSSGSGRVHLSARGLFATARSRGHGPALVADFPGDRAQLHRSCLRRRLHRRAAKERWDCKLSAELPALRPRAHCWSWSARCRTRPSEISN
jgi:hypothetical protein